ncbi:MAG: lipid-A-disaccharide synthase [Chlamydiia bacterium]|nr:lipid-A-disaccharide synthase [Chlamydiia bacterium]
MIDGIRAELYPLGILSVIAFGLRFIIQWYESEKAKRSVVTPLFWKLSLAGNFFLFIHSIIQVHFPICLIQSLQTVLSWRNINLLKPKKFHISFEKTLFLLFCSAFLTILIFLLQGYILENGVNYWLRSPYSTGVHGKPVVASPLVHFIGIIGISAFSLRFWIQWWMAEKHQKSELTKTFWWLSLFGAVLSIIYFSILLDWVNAVGPILAIVPYSRNLWLIYTNEKKRVYTASIFIFAGEKSGDLCGAKLMQELKQKLPHVHFFGVGGKEMQKAGIESLYPIERFQVMGFSDVLKALPQLIISMLSLKKSILDRKPLLCLFIDQPDFSIRLAKKLKKGGYQGKIVQFVAPSVWAWKRSRAEKMAQYFDLLITLFSFEPQYFAHTTLKTIWAGHPIVESINQESLQREPLIALYPGSRPAEVRRNLPKQLEAAALFCQKIAEKGVQFEIAISGASQDLRSQIDTIIADLQKQGRIATSQKITLIPFEERYQVMKRSSLALAKCGTVNLELALHEVPTIVTYELSFLNRFLATYVLNIDLPFYSIVNILKKKEIFPELIKEKTTPQSIADSLVSFYSNPELLKSCKKECKELLSLVQREKTPTLIACEAIVVAVHDT